MARLLALHWTDQELRAIVGSGRGGRLALEQFIVAPLKPEGELGSAKVVEQIRAILAEHRATKLDTVVAIGRAGVELKNLTLPPAPDDELPELVRFQALRELSTATEDSAIDFAPTTFDPAQPRGVLAAALSSASLKRVEQVCEAGSLELKRIVLAPCAAAALVRAHLAQQTDAVLAVDLLGDAVNLIVVVGETITFVRSARIPAVPNCLERSKQLLAEIRRTIGAVQNAAGQEGVAAVRVGKIVLLADATEQQTLTTEIEQALGLHTVALNLKAAVDLPSGLAVPADFNRYAALIGVLLDEIAGRRPQMDFLHPREKPAPVSRRRPLILAAAGVAAVLLLVVGYAWWSISELDAQIKRLADESAALEPAVKQAGAIEKNVAALDAWAAGDITWLDEMSELSREMPPAQDAMLTLLRVTSTDAGGEMQLDGLAQSASVIAPLEKNLRDERHVVEGKGAQQDQRRKKYGWRFKATIDVGRENGNQKKPATPVVANSATTNTAAAKTATASKPTETAAKSDDKSATKDSDATKGDAAKPDDSAKSDEAQKADDKKPDSSAKPLEKAKEPAEDATKGGA